MPYLLDPGCDHTRPHFPDDFKERNWTNFIEIVDTRLLGEEGHEPVLPPLWYVMVLPNDLGQLKYECCRLGAPMFHLCCGKARGARTLSRGEMAPAVFEFLEGKGGAHCTM